MKNNNYLYNPIESKIASYNEVTDNANMSKAALFRQWFTKVRNKTKILHLRVHYYDQVREVVNALRHKKSVFIELEINGAERERVLHFLYGVAYALQGHIKFLKENTVVITPRYVSVRG